jgi:septal ring factor EnvC (AmiA/AmiB activator)
MKSTVKTVKGRGRPKGSKNKWEFVGIDQRVSSTIDQLEKDLERKDHTLEIMRDEIRELEKLIKDQKEKNAFLELDISHLKDIIKRLVEHL